MTERLELYRCNICGNLVEVILDGAGELVCCGEEMEHLNAQNNDSMGLEKHVPVFEVNDKGEQIIRIGSTPHPMINEHYIMFVETISEDKNHAHLHYLYPEMKPEILNKFDTDKITAREYCNIHGLWEAKND